MKQSSIIRFRKWLYYRLDALSDRIDRLGSRVRNIAGDVYLKSYSITTPDDVRRMDRGAFDAMAEVFAKKKKEEEVA